MEKVKIAAGMAFVDYGNVGALVKEATEAGVDYIHADACDMYEMPQGQLMGGHQVIAGIRPYTNLRLSVTRISDPAMFILLRTLLKQGQIC